MGLFFELEIRDEVFDYFQLEFLVDLNKKRSFIGYIFMFGECDISWKATLSVSAIQDKSIFIMEAIKEAIF